MTTHVHALCHIQQSAQMVTSACKSWPTAVYKLLLICVTHCELRFPLTSSLTLQS